MENLTRKQKEILEFIKKTTFKKGISPTFREIMQFFGFKSIKTVQDHLKALEKKGYIKKDPNKSRSIVLDDFSKALKDTIRVPILGQISAGKPILAEENIQGYINLDKFLVKYSKDIFALKVEGNSMTGAGILNGDYVIVKKQPTIENGSIACILIDNEATVKRFYKRKNYIELKPENPDYKPIIITKDTATDILILGKVVGVFRTIVP
jgi:repressor LexA